MDLLGAGTRQDPLPTIPTSTRTIHGNGYENCLPYIPSGSSHKVWRYANSKQSRNMILQVTGDVYAFCALIITATTLWVTTPYIA